MLGIPIVYYDTHGVSLWRLGGGYYGSEPLLWARMVWQDVKKVGGVCGWGWDRSLANYEPFDLLT